ncbi:MAG: hypothetical protein QNJ60_14995 [Xenococcaceae cyanobacterium MO_188.B19]|nr:hypothetical protein [Xenococcaceae cyanobacterium MO_188.B19]
MSKYNIFSVTSEGKYWLTENGDFSPFQEEAKTFSNLGRAEEEKAKQDNEMQDAPDLKVFRHEILVID